MQLQTNVWEQADELVAAVDEWKAALEALRGGGIEYEESTCPNCGKDEHSHKELALCMWSLVYRSPDQDCGYPMRDGTCQMKTGHRGRHSTVAFYCDICGQTRRGRAIPIVARIAPYETEHVADMCFMCERDIDGSQQKEIDQAMDAYYGRSSLAG